MAAIVDMTFLHSHDKLPYGLSDYIGRPKNEKCVPRVGRPLSDKSQNLPFAQVFWELCCLKNCKISPKVNTEIIRVLVEKCVFSAFQATFLPSGFICELPR